MLWLAIGFGPSTARADVTCGPIATGEHAVIDAVAGTCTVAGGDPAFGTFPFGTLYIGTVSSACSIGGPRDNTKFQVPSTFTDGVGVNNLSGSPPVPRFDARIGLSAGETAGFTLTTLTGNTTSATGSAPFKAGCEFDSFTITGGNFITPSTGPTASQRSQTVTSLQNSFNSVTPSVLGTDGLGLNGDGGGTGNGVTFAPTGLSFNRSSIDSDSPFNRDYAPAFGPQGYFNAGQTRRMGNGFNFSVNLQQMARNARSSEAAEQSNMSSSSPKGGRTNSRWITSVSGRYVEFDDSQTGADRDGSLWFVTSALGYRLSDRTVFGVFSRYREGEVSSIALASTLDSSLYGGGVYLASTSASGVRLVGAALYETGDNDILISGATGSFDSETVTLEASLDKRISRGRVWIEPQVRLLYHESDNDDFTDSQGNFVLGDTQTLGRVSFGPRVGTSLGGNGRAELKPFAKVQGVWDFEREDDVTASTGVLLKTGEIALNLGGGLDVQLVNGLALRIAGDWFTYDTELQGWSISGGIGGSFSAFGLASVAPGYASLDFAHNGEDASAMGRVRIPFGGGAAE